MSSTSSLPIDLDPLELAAALERGDKPVLVDCREQWEHEIVRLEDSLLIPLGELADRADEVPVDAQVVVYCHHGIRSRYGAAILREAGVSNARSLRGGIDLWAKSIDPSLPRY